jgi:D-arabinose 1-dehydrogenase-like Zn-dependent alcohol dehydrogenase
MAQTHRAVVLNDFSQPLEIKELPIPTATSGSVVVKVLAFAIVNYSKEVLNGKRGYPLNTPLTPGGSCVGRIHSTGPDTTSLKEGQLVITDSTITARDNPSVKFLLGLHAGATPLAQKLSAGEWRNGAMAEFVKMPLESVYALDEDALLKEQGYAITDLPFLQKLMIPYGGLSEAGVQVGDTVIVAPATGLYGGAAVLTALSMGAKVIACGRSEKNLDKLKDSMKDVSGGKLKTIAWTGDAGADAKALRSLVGAAGADVYIDFSPPEAGAGGKTPAHMVQSIAALKNGGTSVLMGGLSGTIELPHSLLMFNNIIVRGQFMYNKAQALQVIKMAESGNLWLGSKVGQEVVGPFGLEKIGEALELAWALSEWGKNVTIVP